MTNFSKRQQQEQARLQQEWELRQEKLGALREASAIEANADSQFQLQQQIKTEEAELAKLEVQLIQLEQASSGSQPSQSAQPQPSVRNQQNVSGGEATQINDPQAPVILGGGNNTFNFHYGTSQSPQSAANTPQQTVLILAANPATGTRSRLDEEVREIDQGLRLAKQREKFTLEQRWAVRPADVRRAMLEIQPQIVHFTGQGTAADGLVLEDNAGAAKTVSASAIAGLFELFADQVQCVVLNACYSEVQASAIAEHIPYVIGMSDALEERAAISFAVAFYDALGVGRTIEFAYKLACNAIAMEGIEGALVPILKQGKHSG
jgi:CHAT domain